MKRKGRERTKSIAKSILNPYSPELVNSPELVDSLELVDSPSELEKRC